MFAEYTNRKKDIYYIKVAHSKNGRERYYVIKNLYGVNKSVLLQDVPSGFEFYEHPSDGKVVLRKVLKSNIIASDIAIVDSVMKNHTTVSDYIIDKEANSIKVYIGRLQLSAYPELEENFHLIQSYIEKLQFEKYGAIYKAQRFCYLSRNYGWITMESDEDLEYLVEKYCFHIDKETLLDYWIEN